MQWFNGDLHIDRSCIFECGCKSVFNYFSHTTISRTPSGRPPTTITRHSAPIAAASSTARRLSSRTFDVSTPSAVYQPPRQRPETPSPDVRIILAALLSPISAIWWRQGAMPPNSCRKHPQRIAPMSLFHHGCGVKRQSIWSQHYQFSTPCVANTVLADLQPILAQGTAWHHLPNE